MFTIRIVRIRHTATSGPQAMARLRCERRAARRVLRSTRDGVGDPAPAGRRSTGGDGSSDPVRRVLVRRTGTATSAVWGTRTWSEVGRTAHLSVAYRPAVGCNGSPPRAPGRRPALRARAVGAVPCWRRRRGRPERRRPAIPWWTGTGGAPGRSDDGQGDQVPQGLMVVPGVEGRPRRRRPPPRSAGRRVRREQLADGVDGVGGPTPVDLDAAGLQPGRSAQRRPPPWRTRSSAGVTGRSCFCHGWLATTTSMRSRSEVARTTARPARGARCGSDRRCLRRCRSGDADGGHLRCRPGRPPRGRTPPSPPRARPRRRSRTVPGARSGAR